MSKMPGWYNQQQKQYPAIFKAYEELGDACREAGPLDPKTASLVKLAIAVGTRHEGAVHSHTRRSLEAGASLDECRHVALLSLTTIGFPSMMAALSWIEDVVQKSK
ncbi:MAG TPA: carboxymuconolactone decarboxylase family protein [Candidatus Dormibacteraeota bacterium]|jgi:alkylhydroperoxidase/carboxymuconolactone decarboxylase family protein YurZ|nr:carboxymuconolactone decarboxylase family protein [Candidatus Dormibacteraeota bacterium]